MGYWPEYDMNNELPNNHCIVYCTLTDAVLIRLGELKSDILLRERLYGETTIQAQSTIIRNIHWLSTKGLLRGIVEIGWTKLSYKQNELIASAIVRDYVEILV